MTINRAPARRVVEHRRDDDECPYSRGCGGFRVAPASLCQDRDPWPLFENAVVVEALKHRFNTGRRSNLTFFRDADGLECDLLYENGNGIGAIETKAGTRIRGSRLAALDRVAKLLPRVSAKAVVHGGTDRRSRGGCKVVPLEDLPALLARLDASPPLPAGPG